jgi:hypothetical protein
VIDEVKDTLDIILKGKIPNKMDTQNIVAGKDLELLESVNMLIDFSS